MWGYAAVAVAVLLVTFGTVVLSAYLMRRATLNSIANGMTWFGEVQRITLAASFPEEDGGPP